MHILRPKPVSDEWWKPRADTLRGVAGVKCQYSEEKEHITYPASTRWKAKSWKDKRAYSIFGSFHSFLKGHRRKGVFRGISHPSSKMPHNRKTMPVDVVQSDRRVNMYTTLQKKAVSIYDETCSVSLSPSSESDPNCLTRLCIEQINFPDLSSQIQLLSCTKLRTCRQFPY